LNFERTLKDLLTLELNNKKIDYVYIHNLRFMFPEDKNWDAEETVLPISNRNSNPDQLLISPHIITL